MLPSQNLIEPLTELGLNKYESRVYLTLISEGISTAKNISDITSIPYGKVYEIINGLAAKGYVTILPSKPMKCQAVSPTDVLKLMRARSLDKFQKLEKKITKELDPLYQETRKFKEAKGVFWVVNGRSNINNKMEELINRSKKNLKIMTTLNGLKRLVIHKEEMLAAQARGVEITVCAPLNAENKEDTESLSFCNLRNVKEVPTHSVIVDGQESLLVESVPDDDNIVYGRDLGVWITSTPFTKVFEQAFEASFKRGRSYNGNGSNGH